MPHTLVARVQDRPGTLYRAASLLRRHGFNIESLAAARSETPGVSRMTLVVDAEDVDQVITQLHELNEVLEVNDVTHEPTVERETVLVKVHAPAPSRMAILTVTDALGARTADVGTTTMIVEMTGTPDAVDNLLDVLRPFGIQAMMRTGRIAMERGTPAPIALPTSARGRRASRARPAGRVIELVDALQSPESQADGAA